MITLYQAADQLKSVLDLIDEDGVIPPETEQALAQFEGKSLAVTAYILNCDAEAKMIKDAAEKMLQRAKHAENKAERLRQYLAFNMKQSGMTEISCPEFSAKLQPDRDESIEIWDAKQIPADYMRQPKIPEPAPDKTLIKKAIKDGFEVAGARIVKKDRLTIK